MSAWTYKAFGLIVISDILLPELEPGVGIPNVRVTLGKTPPNLPHVFVERHDCQMADNLLLLHVSDVAHYYVERGECITIEAQTTDFGAIRLYLLGTAFGALLLQRGVLPLHGSAIALNGRGVIFIGASGVGKSSLLAAFRARGVPFLTDDVAAVSFDEMGTPWIHPSYPHQKLWRDSVEALSMEISGRCKIRPDVEKYAISETQGFCNVALPLSAVCLLLPDTCESVGLTQLQSVDSLTQILTHTYRPWLLGGLGVKARHLKQCVTLCQQINVLCLIRPKGIFSLNEQMAVIERQMAKVEASPLC